MEPNSCALFCEHLDEVFQSPEGPQQQRRLRDVAKLFCFVTDKDEFHHLFRRVGISRSRGTVEKAVCHSHQLASERRLFGVESGFAETGRKATATSLASGSRTVFRFPADGGVR